MTEEEPIISWVLNHQWRDITKELPPYEVPVLVHRDDGIYLEMRYDKNKVFNPCLDEYGFDIDDKGFVRFSSVGGLNLRNLVNLRVRFANGVEGVIGAEEES